MIMHDLFAITNEPQSVGDLNNNPVSQSLPTPDHGGQTDVCDQDADLVTRIRSDFWVSTDLERSADALPQSLS
jgi:hypothetical protein